MAKEKKKRSLSSKIMIGMGLGIVAGVFFGEYCRFLQVVGDAFIKLLQMTILPYITVSMILGIGSLTSRQAKLLAEEAGLLLLLFWALSFLMVLALPFSFPKRTKPTPMWTSLCRFRLTSPTPASC